MTPTPERALELAELCENEAESGFDAAERAAGTPELADAYMHGVRISREKAAILRHYAEILPKWQAVLDAEPTNDDFQQAAMLIADHFDYPWQYMPEQGRADLRGLARKIVAIIKPAP